MSLKEKIIKGLKWFFYSFIWLGVLLFVLDIVSKQIVKNNMNVGDEIWLIPNFLEIHYIQNNGMAFGLDTGDKLANAIIFISVSIIGTIALTFALIKLWKKSGLLVRSALILMLTGCVGNLIDRSFYVDAAGNHYVVDFIGFFGTNGFPRFNVADSCLVIGTIMLILYLVLAEIKDYKNKNKEEKVVVETKVEEIPQEENKSNDEQ
jgi:signal peptidase II